MKTNACKTDELKPAPHLFPVYNGNQTGYIDRQGSLVIPFQTGRYGQEFSEGFASFEGLPWLLHWLPLFSSKYGYIDERGRVVSRPRFESASPFSEGLAAVDLGNRMTFMRPDGSLLPGRYEGYRSFSEGLACVRIGGKWGYIDREGKWIVPPSFDSIPNDPGFSGGLASARSPGRMESGFIDRRGAWAIQPRFQHEWGFREGLACVKEGGKYGYVTPTGEYAIPPQYEMAWPHSEGLARVKLGGKIGFIDIEGRITLPLQYDHAGAFCEGLAWAGFDPEPLPPPPPGEEEKVDDRPRKIGFIDHAGQFVIPPKYDRAENFSGGVAQVDLGNLTLSTRRDRVIIEVRSTSVFVYVDKMGKIIYERPSAFTGGATSMDRDWRLDPIR